MRSSGRAVVHVSSVHKAGDIRIFHKECKTLASAGYKVTYVIPADQDAIVDGITIRALPPVSGRFQRMTARVWRAYRLARAANGDIYHLHDPELIPIGMLLRLSRKQVIYDAHEDLVDDVLTKEWIPGSLRRVTAAAVQALLGLAGFSFDGFVAATPTIARRFPKRKTITVRNYPFPDEFVSPTPLPFADRPKEALYIGSISRIRGLTEMVKAIALVEDARLTVIGQFETQALFDSIATLSAWQRVDYTPWQPRERLRSVFSEARLGLVLFHPERAHLDALPTKLFEYMAVGLPIVGSNFPLWREIVDDAQCGLLVDPLDVDAIARAISYLIENPEVAQEMGARGRRAILARYNWDSQANALLGLYERVVSGLLSHNENVGHRLGSAT